LSKAEAAYRWIRERVADQTYQPGHKLVLAQIALELDTSVVPVREAIRRLEADGLVTFERNVGARVAMVDQGSYAQSMEAVAILEGAAMAQARDHLGAGDLEEAEAINDRMRALLADFEPAEFTRLNHEFHETLYRRCPNERLRTLVGLEWDRLSHLRDSTFSFVPERALESVDGHSRLVPSSAPVPRRRRAKPPSASTARRHCTAIRTPTRAHPQERTSHDSVHHPAGQPAGEDPPLHRRRVRRLDRR